MALHATFSSGPGFWYGLDSDTVPGPFKLVLPQMGTWTVGLPPPTHTPFLPY